MAGVMLHIACMPLDVRSPAIRRRHLLATAGVALLPAQARAQAVPGIRQLVVAQRMIAVGNRAASVYRLGPADGGSGLILQPGERFRVQLRNQLDEPTNIHWHGQTPPTEQNGVGALLAPHAQREYSFVARPGTHWMHAQHGLHRQRLLAAPLIVRDTEAAGQDMQDVVMMLHDFSWRDAKDILADLAGGGPGMAMPMAGFAGPAALNDVLYDAYLANDRTLAEPDILRVERGVRVRLRIINASSATQFWLDFGSLEDTVLATDGNPVIPLPAPPSVPLAIGQRLDIGFRMPSSGAFPVLAQVAGTTKRTGIILATPGITTIPFLDLPAPQALPPLDISMDRRLTALTPLAPRAADSRHTITLDGTMMRPPWSINDRRWAEHTPITVRLGQRVVLDIVNRTPIAHAMHLHGHHFQLIAVNGAPLSGPMRDTILVPAASGARGSGTISIAFDADNPGKWLLHSHNLYHMAAGMMTQLVYADTTSAR